MYEFLVVYQFTKDNNAMWGWGNIGCSNENDTWSEKDIRKAEKQIKDNLKATGVVITNIMELREEKDV